jgi:Tol biopolymer transport system component
VSLEDTMLGVRNWTRGKGLHYLLPIALVAAGCKGDSITDRDPDAVFGRAVIDVRTFGVDLDPDGYTVDVRGVEQHALPPSGQVDLRLLAGPARLTLGGIAPNCHLAGDAQQTVSISPSGTVHIEYTITCGGGAQHLAYAQIQNGQTDIFVLADGASTPVQLTNSVWRDTDPVWSPNGNRLAYATLSPDSTTSNVVVVRADGTVEATIGSPDSHSGYPAWAPDDDRLLFSSNVGGSSDLYLRTADGSVSAITNTPENELRPAWSPDGTQIVYDAEVADSVGRDLFIMNADGSGARRLATGGRYNFHASWSPDGKMIAFASQRDGNEEIYVVNVDGTNLRRLTTGGSTDGSPVWSADGKFVIFESNRSGGVFSLYKRAVFGSETIRVTTDVFDHIDPALSR